MSAASGGSGSGGGAGPGPELLQAVGSGGVEGNGAAASAGEGRSGEVLSMLALYMDLGLKCQLRVSIS